MSQVSEQFKSSQFKRMVSIAYFRLIKDKDTTGMQNLVDYMRSVGFDHDASNNQLTFWLRTSRSPTRERIVTDISGPQNMMISRNFKSVANGPYFFAYHIDEAGAAAIQREMDNAPDKMEDARALLKDRANDQDPALRGRPLSTSIAS